MFFKVAQKSRIIQAAYERKFVTKTFKNHPIWSHWFELTNWRLKRPNEDVKIRAASAPVSSAYTIVHIRGNNKMF